MLLDMHQIKKKNLFHNEIQMQKKINLLCEEGFLLNYKILSSLHIFVTTV